MKCRLRCLALLLASGSVLPAQQDPAALLVLSHALDSKLAFTAPDLNKWSVMTDASATGGTLLSGNGELRTTVKGPVSISFRLCGDLEIRTQDLSSLQSHVQTTYYEDGVAPRWQDYRLNIPTGDFQITWRDIGYNFNDPAKLDAFLVNVPADQTAAQQALDYPGSISFPDIGQWTEDKVTFLSGGASLLGFGPMQLPVTGPAILRYSLNIGGAGSSSGLTVRNGTQTLFEGGGLRQYRWLPVAVLIPDGEQLLTLSNPSRTGYVWMDTLAVESAGTGLAEALGYPGPWSLSGPYPWHAQSTITYDGTSAAAVCYPSRPSDQPSRLATRVMGPCELSFRSSYEGTLTAGIDNNPAGIKLRLNGRAFASTLPVQSTYPIRQVDWPATRVLIPEGDHAVEWTGSPGWSDESALFLIDGVQVSPVPLDQIRTALDGDLPWEVKGIHIPAVTSHPHAVGGALLESPPNRTGSCAISLPLQGPARFRFRFSGTASSSSSQPTPHGRISIFKEGIWMPAPVSASWQNQAGLGSTYEIALPEGHLEMVMDLRDYGTIAPQPVQLDAVGILPAAGVAFWEWAAGLSLTAESRNLDNDGDKRSNFFEYAFGTYPYYRDSREDVLALEDASGNAPAALVFKWNPTRIDAAWAIQESPDLKTWTDRWVPLAAEAEPAEGEWLVWRKEMPQDPTKKWFRAIVRPVVP